MAKIVGIIVLILHSFVAFSQQHEQLLDLKSLLKNLSNKYQIHFAYPTPLINNIKIHYSEENFRTLDEELNHYLSLNDIEYQKMNTSHIMLRKKIKKETSNDFIIQGKIVDTLSQHPIPYCGIYLTDFSISTMTDENGHFKLRLPYSKKDKSIIVSLLGYKEKMLSVQNLVNPTTVILSETEEELSEVIITYVAPFSSIINKEGNVEVNKAIMDLNKSAAPRGNDINATIQLLPGVNAHEDNDAGLKIRGGNSEETMVILDEMPLYNATHYYGFFNAVNAEYIDHMQLYKNNLPIEYQGGISGLLKLNSKNIIADTSNLTLSSNSFMSSAIADIKLNDNMGFILGGRSTYGTINLGMGVNNTSTMIEKFQQNNTQVNAIVPQYHFYDLNGKLNTKLNNNILTSFNFYESHDDMNALTEIKVKNTNFGEELKKDLLAENKVNRGASINSTYLLNNQSSFKISLHHSIYQWDKNIESSIQNFSSNTTNTFSNAINSSSYLNSSGVKLYLDQNETGALNKIGIEYINYRSENNQVTGDSSAFYNKVGGNLFNIFNEYHLKLVGFDIRPAYRLSYFTSNGKSNYFVSPQLYTIKQLTKNSYIKASTSINNQFIREINFEDPFGQQIFITSLSDLKNIPVSRSWNSMIGYNISKKNVFFDIELWYKKTMGAVSLFPDAPPIRQRSEMTMGGPPPIPTAITYSLITGERKAKGVDVMIGFQNSKLTSWISYTLSKTQDRYERLYEGLWFSAPNDRRHQLKLSNNLTVKKFNFSVNYFFSSGKPYLAYELVEGKIRNDKQNRDQIKHLPEYHRVDIGAIYNFKILKKETQLGFSVFNLFNRQNLNFLQYNYKIPGEPQNGGPQPNQNLTLGTTYGLINRLISFEFKIKI